ncbi:hypothetical protein P4S72_07700 [Vibrio sp. PP-XX7]
MFSCATFTSWAEADIDAQTHVETPFHLEHQLGWRLRYQQVWSEASDYRHAPCDHGSLVSGVLHPRVFRHIKATDLRLSASRSVHLLTCADCAAGNGSLLRPADQYEHDLDNYTHHLLPLPRPADLRPDLPRTPVRSLAGKVSSVMPSAGVSHQLYELSRHRGYSLYAMTLGALALLVNQQHGRSR